MMAEGLDKVLEDLDRAVQSGVGRYRASPEPEEVGKILTVGRGIVWAEGLGRVRSEELLTLNAGVQGMALDILEDRIGIALFGPAEGLRAGEEVLRTGRVVDVPAGPSLVGRVINPLGRPMDGAGPLRVGERRPVQREAPKIIDRAPVEKPLETGIKVIDALIPIGRGQRELILGDRQTGKSAVALDTVIHQKGQGVTCVYCAIGQRTASVAKVIETLRRHEAMAYSVVVVAEGGDPPGLQYIAPYAATTVAEFFMERGEDVLIVYDDLTQHARAYRQLSLLLRRPPGREAFPGDIFFIHSRLLERATRLKPDRGGGSLTALPIIETEAQNLSAYIPTNLISITDGQIYLSPDLFHKGNLPAVDVGKSVSRVGGKAQVPGYRKVSGDLRLSYAQFQELETFSRFGTRLDKETRETLDHGVRVREILKQDQISALTAGEQIGVLYAVTNGLLDAIPLDRISEAERLILERLRQEIPNLDGTLGAAEPKAPIWGRISALMAEAVAPLKGNHEDPGRAR